MSWRQGPWGWGTLDRKREGGRGKGAPIATPAPCGDLRAATDRFAARTRRGGGTLGKKSRRGEWGWDPYTNLRYSKFRSTLVPKNLSSLGSELAPGGVHIGMLLVALPAFTSAVGSGGPLGASDAPAEEVPAAASPPRNCVLVPRTEPERSVLLSSRTLASHPTFGHTTLCR